MPATTGRVPCAAAHAIAATSTAASHLRVSIAEIANAVRGAERDTPRLQSCVQSSVVAPTLLCWRWARLLLHTGHLYGDIGDRIVSLILLAHLVEMPAAGAPATSMPAASAPAGMPATAARMHRAAAHAVAPRISAAPHSGVLIAEVANAVRGAERHTPLLQSCVQSSVIVPTLLCWRRARLMLHTGHLDGRILLVLFGDLVEVPATSMPAASAPAGMPATAPRMHCGAAHAVAPRISAALHPGVLIAEIANAVR